MERKKVKFQKYKHHKKSGSGDWKSKFLKSTNADNFFKSIIMKMSTDEKKSQALISVRSVSNSQATVSVLMSLPNPSYVSATASSDAATQSNNIITTLVQA